MLSYILAAPAEIRDQILQYLTPPNSVYSSTSDLVNFSLCAKTCRDLAIPLLFSHIKLVPDSIVAFSDGGTLSSVRHHVRKIGIKWKPKEPYTDVDIIEGVSLCVRSLRLFPRARELGLSYKFSVDESISNNLPIAIWKTISTALPNLRVFKFNPRLWERKRSPEMTPDLQERYSGIHALLCPESRQFIGPAYISDEEASGSFLPSPWSVERILLEAPKSSFRWNSGLNLVNFLIAVSTGTLRSLSIKADYLELLVKDGFQPFISPNVVDLDIGVSGEAAEYDELLKYFAASFPNVQTLSLISHSDGRTYDPPLDPLDLAYSELALMPKLRKVTVPWPWNQGTRFRRRELAGVIRRLISSGLEQLEEIKFLRKTPWYVYGHGFECRKCWVKRDGAMRIKLLWGQTYHGATSDSDTDREENLKEEDGYDSDDAQNL
ncbi:hypothetical protein TWF281_011481 [Arthrobotrys megalospora]